MEEDKNPYHGEETLLLISSCMGQAWVALVVSGTLEKLEVESSRRISGNIYKGIVERLAPAIDAAFVKLSEDEYGFIQADDIAPKCIGVDWSGRISKASIEMLKVGQPILVQVTHEPRGQKCARLTTRITLSGKFVELITQGADHTSVSRAIASGKEKTRLLHIAEKHRPFDCGIHVLSEAAGRSEDEIANDIKELIDLWHEIIRRYESEPAPALLYRSMSLIERVAFLAAKGVSKIVVDSEEHYKSLLSLAVEHQLDIADKIELHDSPIPLFDAYGIAHQIEAALSKVVKLPSGAYIVIETTEALTSIDVNSGHVLIGDSREMLLRINMEAADEIARQLRLRNIGGLVVVDFIDMHSTHDWSKLQKHLEQRLLNDDAETRILTLSPIGVLELVRQRKGSSLEEVLTEQCECCAGAGRVLSASTIAVQLRRKLLLEASIHPADIDAVICAHPEVIATLIQSGEAELERLEVLAKRHIWLFGHSSLKRDEFEIAFGNEALKTQTDIQPKVGEQITLVGVEQLYPRQSPSFVLLKNKLVRLPGAFSQVPQGVTLKVESVGRWYANAVWSPLVGVEKTEDDRQAIGR